MAVVDKSWVGQIPGFIGIIFSIGSLIFSVGVLYSDVATLKAEVSAINVGMGKQESILTRVDILQAQVQRSEQAQDKLTNKLDNIDKSLASISIGLARLEERLPERVKEKVK